MLKKLLSKTLFILAVTASAFSANAALITQDIISDANGVIGSITINTVPSEATGGGFTSVSVFESFNLFGIEIANADDAVGEFFFAEYNAADLFAGIEFMTFDLSDLLTQTFAFSGLFSAGFNDGQLDAFEIDPAGLALFLNDISFGQAAVVPEPSMFLLLIAGFMSIAIRRRKV